MLLQHCLPQPTPIPPAGVTRHFFPFVFYSHSSQNGEEGGAWPNNQFDTEMLQAMILASANGQSLLHAGKLQHGETAAISAVCHK